LHKPWNIFLLEDDEADKLLVQVTLKHSGVPFTLTHAKTMDEARSILDSSGALFDCALLDRSVPGGCGLDLVSHNKLQSVPCIMLTGNQDETVALQALQRGLEDYIMKGDITRHTLVRAIRYAMERNSIKCALSEAKKKLEELVKTDHLTGLLNRRGLEELLQRLLQRNSNFEENHGVILIDIDNFKAINDTLGYDAGDEALRFVATKLRLCSRPLDHVARIGGDEFIILLTNVEMEQCAAISERIRTTFEETLLNIRGSELNVTVSMGVSALNNASTVEELFKATQAALHCSKKQGKNAVCMNSTIPPSR
jgi:diguanylate cyclase (GGDEF)-like protein